MLDKKRSSKLINNDFDLKAFLHDISNPLALAQFNLDILFTKFDPVKHNEIYKLIEPALFGIRQASKMIVTVREDMSAKPAIKDFSVIGEVKEVLKIYLEELILNEIELFTDFKTDLFIYNNPVLFHRIIQNLLINAIDALILSSKKDKKLSITTFQNSSYFQLSIKDNGIGMSKIQLNSIFNSIDTSKINGSGNGLGVVISYLNKYFDSTLECKSSLGKGASFTINFPESD